MSLLQDPIQTKKAPPADTPQFKRPTLADLRGPAPVPDPPSTPASSASEYVRPKMGDLKDVPDPDRPSTPASSTPSYARPKIGDLKDVPVSDPPSTPGASTPGYARPKMGDLKDVQVNFTMDQKLAPEYTPHTVEEYRELQAMQDLSERGGLGPSLDEEWERKQRNRARILEFGQKIAQDNKIALPKRANPRSAAKKEPTKRDKMREYAGNIPKPKLQPKDRIPELHGKPRSKSVPVAAQYDLEAELHRHGHFVNRVETLLAVVREYLE
jgi:hypothetical protein